MRERFLSIVGLTVLLVGVVLVAVGPQPVAAAPMADESDSWCVTGVGECTLQGDTITCQESAACESEGGPGDSESGEEQVCEPGDWLSVQREETQADGRCHASIEYYQCGYDGKWVRTNREEYTVAECRDQVTVCQLWAGPDYTDICWEVPLNPTPCEDMNWSANGIQCVGEYGLNVSVSVPCQRVRRIPYPRSMVLVPALMQLDPDSPAWREAWSQTLDYNACLNQNIKEGDRLVRNYRIGIAWGRDDDIPPVWRVEDAAVQSRPDGSAVVSWEKASWGKPRCGPSLDPEGDPLPAYRAQVYTNWTAFWRRIYERQKTDWECVYAWQCSYGQDIAGQCDHDGDGHFDRCYVPKQVLCDDDENDDGIPDEHCWDTVDSGWQPFDLRMFGYPTSQFVSGAAGPAPTAREPNPGCNGLCIPVIEVQGVIRNARGQYQ
ncbi:MAG: hypothetical protein J7M39_12970 [Anaerolineae bacterium]|nr:hypothetical protein [Anaerolineae bacterium]